MFLKMDSISSISLCSLTGNLVPLLIPLAGCITRDPRMVERKKEGQRKARAKYTWYASTSIHVWMHLLTYALGSSVNKIISSLYILKRIEMLFSLPILNYSLQLRTSPILD